MKEGFLQADLLVIDDRLLRQIAADALGEEDDDNPEGLSLAAYLLSFWLSGFCLIDAA